MPIDRPSALDRLEQLALEVQGRIASLSDEVPSDTVLRLLCCLRMCADPAPLKAWEMEAIDTWLNQLAKARGFEDWIHAFHGKAMEIPRKDPPQQSDVKR